MTMRRLVAFGRPRAGLVMWLCGVALVGGWRWGMAPARDRLAADRVRLQASERELARGRADAERLPALNRDVRALMQSSGARPDAGSPEMDAAAALFRLQSLAAGAGLDVTSASPQSSIENSHYTAWPIAIAFRGRYDGLLRFADGVAAEPHPAFLSNLKIAGAAPAENAATVTASCVVTWVVWSAP